MTVYFYFPVALTYSKLIDADAVAVRYKLISWHHSVPWIVNFEPKDLKVIRVVLCRKLSLNYFREISFM